MVYRVGAPKFHQLDEDQARRSMVKLQHAFQPDAPAVASVLEVPIGRPGRGQGVLLARAYRPIGAAPSEALPMLLFLHGGGWCIGSVDTHDAMCRELCNAAGVLVFSVDYRLAPEHPFPAAVEDAALALRWLQAHGGELGGIAERIAIGGDSAGGNLALVTTLGAIDQGMPVPLLQCLVYPCVDIYAPTASRERYAQGYFLDEETLAWFFERYLPGPGDALDWRASPALAWDLLDRLPPLCLIAAECDPLVDEGRQLAAHLSAAGIDVERHEFPGLVHGFITLGGLFPQASRAIAVMAESIGRHLHVPGQTGPN
ncbi:MAG: alpha/beta hydrolase [Rhodocyclaceae bacterium]|nr:alpha/beta hydrolase [Rhodocyclaceae bacterium]